MTVTTLSSPSVCSVLVIDDDEDDFILVRDMLADVGGAAYRVEWVRHGAEAIARIGQGGVDACLLDYRLGGEDGLDVLRTLVALPRHPAVVIATGQGNDQIDRQAVEIGAADYLVKREMTSDRLDRALRYAVGQRRMMLTLSEREERLRLMHRAIQSAVNGVLICDARTDDFPIVFTNAAFERITGYRHDEVLGRNPRFLNQHGDEHRDAQQMQQIHQALQERHEVHVVLRNFRKSGDMFWNDMFIAPVRDEEGEVSHFVGIINDVTANKRYEQELAHQATHDALTGLPNRNLLADRLSQAVALARRHQRNVGVLFIDLDHFKVVNDGIGHHVGDALLQVVARRMSEIVREGDTVSRLGGDEFVIVCPELDAEDDVMPVVERLYRVLEEAVMLEGEQLRIGASMGLAFFPKDGDDAQTLLRNADLAMYRAKDCGRGQFQCFKPELDRMISERVRIETMLRRALERGEFELHYQPQVSAVSGQLSGLEALVRWHHPERGLMLPGQFIQVAEETRLIVPIGEWVLEEACRQMVAWRRDHDIAVPVAVNVSVAQLQRNDFLGTVGDVLQRTGLEPQWLELEITESLVMDNPETLCALFQGLRDLGVRICVDDFGTGYSNLSYLKRLPVDRLKIDQSFVRDIVVDPGDAAICRAIIAVAHNLRLGVVAEGVETEAQAVYLGRSFCDDLQGYHIQRPIPAGDVPALLKGAAPMFSPPEPLRSVRTLLVVDDEVNVLAAVRRLLRADGYKVLTAQTAEEGFAQLASHEVQVVIADQRLGTTMTGAQFLERVKDLHPRTLRIVLSGYTDLDAVTQSVNRGAIYKFLLKPWDNEHLRNELREAFWHQELNAAVPPGVLDAAAG